jgi:steroid delta-isomerase-like uncharacterized protein
MSIEANKALVRRFIEEIFVNGNVLAADELAAADFTPRSWPSVSPGLENLKQAVVRVSASLSDVRMTIEDMIAEDDRVAVRLTAHARPTGNFMGIPATGKAYTMSEIHIFRVATGKVAEHWLQADYLGMMQQLGVMPAPEQTKG